MGIVGKWNCSASSRSPDCGRISPFLLRGREHAIGSRSSSTLRSEQAQILGRLDGAEASRPIVGVRLFNLGLGIHDKRTARDDRLMQRTTGIEQSAQWFVLRSDHHLGCLPVVATGEPSDVARCYGFAFSADGALALQDDNDRVVVAETNAPASGDERSTPPETSASLSEPRERFDETTTRAADRPWLGLAMTRGSRLGSFLFVRSAPWRRAQ